ncbi:hypothetical protein Aple_072150 [Acrocarpospora pleiomorpha]|uniref:Uncharacterized protein n=1 Tax=Acrocarpospora pleiomorpha TaxID=90975 RepID=A0A5M3XTV9_9ACTN|nr:hypothetical protein [Acrocarpospora pleiomorpha]GES24316.1 hypothetical protein Aple_072150 [Acrocarpospora pleiomorpha]
MPEHDDLSAEAARREVDRAQGAVRKSGRRGAWFFLGMWLGSTAYWLATLLGSEAVKDYAIWVPGALVVAGALYLARQQVYGRLQSRLSFSVTYAFVGTTVIGAVYNMFLHPQDPGPLWAVADVLVALIAGAPLLYGAVRIFRSAEDR